MLIYSRKLSSRGVLAESKAYNYFKRLVLVTQSWSARSTNQFPRSKLDAASSTGFPKFGAWWDEATSTPVAYYSGESGGEGSDGKGREKNGKACEILCRIFAKSVENVKIGSYTEDGGFF